MENKRKRYSLAVLFAIMLCFVSCVFNVHAEKYSPTDAGEVIIHRTTTPMKQMLIFLIVQRQNLLLVMMEDCQQQIRKYSQMQQYYTSLQNGRMAVPAEEQHLWLIKHKL